MKSVSMYAMLVMLLMTSCEKFATEEPGNKNGNEENGNVNIQVRNVENDDLGSLLSLGIFHIDQKTKVIHQSQESSGFGHFSMSLSPNTYRMVAIAHQGTGNCTISSPEKITFPSNKLTDTFYYYSTLEVEDEDIRQEISLSRATSMFTLHINDSIPKNAKRIKFYYTGGSSTLDATTGYGCVNSRQTEIQDVHTEQHDYSVYTFPHEDGKKLKIVITVLDAEAKSIAELTLQDVAMKRNQITRYSGNLFHGTPSGSITEDGNGFEFTFKDSWEGETHYTFR